MNHSFLSRIGHAVLWIILVLLLAGWNGYTVPDVAAAFDGDWSGTTNSGRPVSFVVSSSGSQWNAFSLETYFIATSCYNIGVTMTISIAGPGSITNNQFSYTGSDFSFTGQFSDSTHASGTYSFKNRLIVISLPFPPNVCTYYLTQSGTWTAQRIDPPPGAFAKLSPVNGASNQSTSLTLSWASSSYADSYEYCYDMTNDNACSNWTNNGTSTSVLLNALSKEKTYYWHVRALDSSGTTYSNGSQTAFWSFSVHTNTDVIFGGVEQGSYMLQLHTSQQKSYTGMNTGPVKIASTDGTSRIASQRVLYGNSYSEMMGLPFEQLTKEYLFPYYNNVAMDSQLRVSNVGGADTTITVYLGTQQIDQYTLAAGGASRKNYPFNSGPLRVTSSASNILATIRVLYAGSSYSELMGLPVEQLSKEYLFPYYNNVAMDSQLRVSNVGGADTTITAYLGNQQLDSYTLAAGGATRKNYGGKNSGPLRVTSTDSNILTTIRVLYAGNSLSELMGFPVGQLSQSYWYPVYDNMTLDSQLRVSNVGGDITTITVYAGTEQIDSYELGKGAATRKNYPKNTGPLHVVSSTQPILTTVRLLYGSSLYEMTGLPNEQLSTQYFFPWYNNYAMNSELRFAVP
jgi:hypothetical protein